MRRLLPIVVLLLALAIPAVAGAQTSSPFDQLPQAPPQQETVVVAPSAADDDGLDTWQQVLIFAGGFLLLAAIAFYILGDAKAAAPDGDDPYLEHEHQRKGSRAPVQKSKRRSRTRAQKRARKANRPR